MKSRTIITIRMAVLSAALALFAAASLPSWAAGSAPMNGPAMTAKEARTLAATARTAEEHLKLARYFNEQGDQNEAEARGHDEMIEAYRNNPTTRAEKTPGGVGTIAHCEFVAKSNREMAKALREMAATHEEMARAPAK